MFCQWVCLVCGYNMIGEKPEKCPFCGAPSSKFIASEECTERYEINPVQVHPKVQQLKSSPKLGMEHSAYAIKTDEATLWVDCPSSFQQLEVKPDAILFTHCDFMGACNQYQNDSDCRIFLNKADFKYGITKQFQPYITDATEGNFEYKGIEAVHINGHTPGFTAYYYEDICCSCDLAILTEKEDSVNTFRGPYEAVVIALEKLIKECEKRSSSIVCCWNQAFPFDEFKERVEKII